MNGAGLAEAGKPEKREYRILEYDKIRALLSAEVSSELTRRETDALEPVAVPHIVRERLAETDEAVCAIMRKGSLPLGELSDIAASVAFAERGGSLTPKQLAEIASQAASARRTVAFLKNDLPELPILSGLRDALSTHGQLEAELTRCLLSDTELADGASPELGRIRRRIILKNEAIRERLSRIVTSSDNRDFLRDDIVTLRQGRYVIPVKQEHKQKFPGMIHDRSATGATLFIEPQAVVNMNNELRELELAEEREVERILAELSAAVAAVGGELTANQNILIRLDFIFAKGRLSVNMKATAARINTSGELRIKNGRHPLIPADRVVPISLSLGGTRKILIVTGPNTGGKTVTLKTAGLFLLMTEAGLHVPADDGTEMPLMERVFADIGDEQSIEQSLSTFSSHMRNIVEIAASGTSRCLALIDELGAGTDPTEGAALAVAVLERLKSRGVMTLATTHYAELKKFAIAEEGVENASMAFDPESLSPTFELRIGAPGRSNAFEISARLGMDRGIIERAARLLDASDIRFESVIRSIEADRRAAETALDEATALKLSLQRQKEESDARIRAFDEKRDALMRAAKEEARETLREAKEQADRLHRELRELPRVTDARARNRRIEEVRRHLRDMEAGYRSESAAPENPNPLNPARMRVGDRVKILSLDKNGELVTLPDEKGEAVVQVGRMRVAVAVAGLADVARERGGKKKPRSARPAYGELYRAKVETVSVSVNVHGEDLESALIRVDKYLDDAFIAGLREVTVNHGKGEGILRRGIREMLKGHKHVKSFRNGDFHEGGDGVTVCVLKENG